MIQSIISLGLLAVSVVLSFRHSWRSFQAGDNSEQLQMINDLGIHPASLPFLGIFTMMVAVLLLFPKTFFVGNLLNAVSILAIMALALNAGHIRFALIEIPFLIIPLVLIWLKYPFKT